jgi:hypothetical protein
MDSPINVATAAENRPVYRYMIELSMPDGIRGEGLQSLTKTRIPSASAFQRSVIFSSSSSVLSRYMENRPSDPSVKVGSPGDPWDEFGA